MSGSSGAGLLRRVGQQLLRPVRAYDAAAKRRPFGVGLWTTVLKTSAADVFAQKVRVREELRASELRCSRWCGGTREFNSPAWCLVTTTRRSLSGAKTLTGTGTQCSPCLALPIWAAGNVSCDKVPHSTSDSCISPTIASPSLPTPHVHSRRLPVRQAVPPHHARYQPGGGREWRGCGAHLPGPMRASPCHVFPGVLPAERHHSGGGTRRVANQVQT